VFGRGGKYERTIRHKAPQGLYNSGPHIHLSQRYGMDPDSGETQKSLKGRVRNKSQTFFKVAAVPSCYAGVNPKIGKEE
jgi:hypothetical protein